MHEPSQPPPDRDADVDPYDLEAATREHYEDAALYDFEYRRRRADVNHYRRLARGLGTGIDILELGCGTGRVLAPLVRDGHRVVGLDASATMLARARTRLDALPERARARALLVRGDMRAFALSRRFPLVVAAFNSLQHLYTRTDVAACLARVREHLAPGGLFAFDVLNPDLRWLVRDARKRWARTRFTHPSTGERWEYSTNQTYDPVTQIAYIRLYYEPVAAAPLAGPPPADDAASPSQHAASTPSGERRTRVVRLAHRQFFPAELEALLAASGLRMVARHGGFSDEPFEGGSESQVVISTFSVDKP